MGDQGIGDGGAPVDDGAEDVEEEGGRWAGGGHDA